ncbi:hypothetical protein RRG08_039654 [Elysia crispata]|uniref:Uncharacterized protein n=1 Tax=Elysia crispata TaxID=231223 RepID=A0AAE0Y9X4_9GAST|nr:hypothetical protein RRG08_039654 [Elysia crispata]
MEAGTQYWDEIVKLKYRAWNPVTIMKENEIWKLEPNTGMNDVPDKENKIWGLEPSGQHERMKYGAWTPLFWVKEYGAWNPVFPMKENEIWGLEPIENGTLSCLHSLADGDVVYVTLYNQDDSTDGSNSYQFVCVALLLENNQVFFNQNPMDCDDFSVLNATVADFIMDPVCDVLRENDEGQDQLVDEVSITCSFESALQGDWLSNRKGELTISADTVSGFEPYGLTCTDCTDQPTDFECYQQSGSIYLIRSARTFLNSLPVRIYVCLDMTFVSSTKYIYYQAHSAQASDLEDYLAVLNAAQPVNSLTEVCTQSTPYPPELHSVLLSAASPQSGAAACPEQFVSVYNTSVSSCDFTLSACDVDTQLKLSSTSCDNSPFYTTGGVLSCIYSITDGSTTYLTLLNHDSSTDSNSTFQFTCIASELDGTNLRFTETSGGCHEGQTPSTVNTTNGAEHLFLYLASSSFPWIIIIGVAAGVIFLILVALVIYCCCGRRCLAERRARNKESEEESIIGSKDGDGVEGDDGKKTHWRETNEKDDRRYKDIFTVGTARNPITRGLGKSKKRKRRKRKHGKERSAKEGRDGSGDSSSGSSGSGSGSDYSDDFTSDDSDTSLSSEARIRKMLGSRYNLHVALAWSNRENDPELVQDEHQPQNRHFYESKEMLLRGLEASSLTFNKSKPLGRIVSTSAVLGPANWRKRSQRDRGDQSHLRDGRRIGVDDASLDKDRSAQFLANGGRRRPTRLDPIQSQGRLDGTRDVTKLHKGFGLLKPEHMEFLAQYQAYTTTRKILEDEGFFDTQLGHTLLAGEQFGFNKQEELLNPSKTPEETKDALEDFSSEVALAGQRERQKASRRVMISARPAATAVLPHSDQGGTRAGETQPDSGTEGLIGNPAIKPSLPPPFFIALPSVTNDFALLPSPYRHSGVIVLFRIKSMAERRLSGLLGFNVQ